LVFYISTMNINGKGRAMKVVLVTIFVMNSAFSVIL
jgi:hypothetical protein